MSDPVETDSCLCEDSTYWRNRAEQAEAENERLRVEAKNRQDAVTAALVREKQSYDAFMARIEAALAAAHKWCPAFPATAVKEMVKALKGGSDD